MKDDGKNDKDKKFNAELLPLGKGYKAGYLPTEEKNPEIVFLKESSEEMLSEEPLPSEEDEYYDFESEMHLKGYDED